MKLTAILLLTAAMQVSARSVAQKVTYSAEAVPLVRVFSVIKAQTGYFFFYRNEDLKDTKAVSCHWDDLPLQAALENLFKDQPLSFEVQGNTIVVSRAAIPRLYSPLPDSLPVARSLHGRVIDSAGNPLAGASVTIKGSHKGTATDLKGEFTLLSVTNNNSLVISFTGYATREYKFTGQQDIAITMSRSSSPLDEIVVVAYGTTTERTNVGSVTTVRSEEIQRQPVADVLQALEANVPGLNISQNSGRAGAGYATIQIRGVNSISSGSSPLFIIDGVPVTGIDQFEYGPDPFSIISPSDIESVSILKDADATAIYGSRGGNGVILITTKKGRAGETKVTANLSSGFNSHPLQSHLLNTAQYLQMRNEAFKNDGITPDAINDPDLFGYGVGADPNRYTDWQKALIENTGHMTDAQLTVSGGTGRTTFDVGAALHRESPTLPGHFNYERPSLHFNLSNVSNDQRFNITLSGSYSVTTSNTNIQDIASYAIVLPPNLPPLVNPDGSFNFYLGQQNPYALLTEPTTVKTKTLIAGGTIGYKILPGLELKSSFGYSDLNRGRTTLMPGNANDPAYGVTPGAGSFDIYNENSWQVEPQLEYTRTIGEGKLTALAGGTYQGLNDQDNFIYASNYASNQLNNYATASSITATDNYTSYKYAAVFARLNYNLNEKYLLNLTGRRDGSSRFGPGRQFGSFGAAAAGWVFSKEDFVMNALPWLSFGKLRASYGLTGNDQIGDYKYLDTYGPTSASSSALGGIINSGILYAGQATVSPTGLYNPDYGWETTRKLGVGLDLGLLKDRLLLTADWYRNRSSSQLVNYSVPATTGFPSILENLPAIIGNQGWEFVLNTINVQKNDFSWSSSFNLTIPRNKLIAFPDFANSSYSNTYVIGQPLSVHKVFKYLGVDKQTGIYTFADKDGKPTIAPTYIVDQTSMVNTDRAFYGGLSNTFRYRGLQLIFTLQYVKQKSYDPNITIGPGGNVYNYFTKELSRWQKPGDVTSIEKFTQNYGSDAYNAALYALQSERSYTDASYIRLKNVALSYDFDKRINARLHSKGLRVYVNAQNLLTLTHYVGMDPETGGLGFLPPLRTIVAGVQCSF